MTRKYLDTAYSEVLEDRSIARSYFNVNKNIGQAGVVKYDTQIMLQKAAERKGEKGEYSKNTVGSYVTKTVEPVFYKEDFDVSAKSVREKQFGGIETILSPEQIRLVPDFVSNVVAPEAERVANKIVTDLDLQAVEILTTGGVAANDGFAGAEYIPSTNTNHFDTVNTAWTDNAATPLADLGALAKKIRLSGMQQIETIIMNESTYDKFITRPSVVDSLDTRRLDLGQITLPASTRATANYWGDIAIGGQRVAIWVESAYYTNDAGEQTPFIPDNKVILLSNKNRFEQHFGSLARFENGTDNLMQFLTGPISVENNLQMFQIANLDKRQTGLSLSLDCSALLVAKSKGFGCLTVG